MSVVLPAPLGPTMTVQLPCGTVALTCSRMASPLRRTDTSRKTTALVGSKGALQRVQVGAHGFFVIVQRCDGRPRGDGVQLCRGDPGFTGPGWRLTLSGYCGSVKMAPTCWLRIALISFIISEADGACVSSA